MVRLLGLAATHGRLCLVAGLVAGLLLPDLAQAMRPWLGAMVAGLIFVAALRIGPKAALGSLGDLSGSVLMIAVFQLALPLAALGVFTLLGMAETAVALALVLMLAAPSITGSANFTILVGHDPAPALRLMVLGTTVFPFTVLPVLWLLPGIGGAEIFAAAARLLMTIALATGAGFAVRAALSDPAPEHLRALDGLSAILLAVLVIGLMSGLGPALLDTPLVALGWIATVFAANFGLQIAAFFLLRPRAETVPAAIVAGNRNFALFLVALPPEFTVSLLVFIGAYQLPMYLTPLLLGPLYGRLKAGHLTAR